MFIGVLTTLPTRVGHYTWYTVFYYHDMRIYIFWDLFISWNWISAVLPRFRKILTRVQSIIMVTFCQSNHSHPHIIVAVPLSRYSLFSNYGDICCCVVICEESLSSDILIYIIYHVMTKKMTFLLLWKCCQCFINVIIDLFQIVTKVNQWAHQKAIN